MKQQRWNVLNNKWGSGINDLGAKLLRNSRTVKTMSECQRWTNAMNKGPWSRGDTYIIRKKTKHWPEVGLMLGHRRRRWLNLKLWLWQWVWSQIVDWCNKIKPGLGVIVSAVIVGLGGSNSQPPRKKTVRCGLSKVWHMVLGVIVGWEDPTPNPPEKNCEMWPV